jgi:FkbM family methyltransferase
MPDSAITRRTVECGGHQFDVFGYETDHYFSYIDYFIKADEKLALVIERVTSDTPVIIDVGANVGATVALISKLRPKATVIAVEPSARAFSALHRTLAANPGPKYHALNICAGAERRMVPFNESDNLSGSHIDSRSGNNVQADSLDNVASHLGQVEFIKIDVEGYELDVIAGMEMIEKRDRPVIYLEFNSWTIMAWKGMNPRDFLRELGRRFEFVLTFDRATRTLKRVSSEQDRLDLLYRNLMVNECEDDVVATNNIEKAQQLLALVPAPVTASPQQGSPRPGAVAHQNDDSRIRMILRRVRSLRSRLLR